LKETDELGKLDNNCDLETVTNNSYGPLKALCEDVIKNVYGDRSLIIRPGIIAGPHDQSDRFLYWVKRIAKGGKVICPEKPDKPIQFIDVRDLSEWIITLAEQNVAGCFNATGPEKKLSLSEMLQICKLVTGSNSELFWVSEDFLEKNEIVFPFNVTEEDYGHFSVDISKAIQSGLKFRALEETIKDTLDWYTNLKDDIELKVGPTIDREKQLLKEF